MAIEPTEWWETLDLVGALAIAVSIATSMAVFGHWLGKQLGSLIAEFRAFSERNHEDHETIKVSLTNVAEKQAEDARAIAIERQRNDEQDRRLEVDCD